MKCLMRGASYKVCFILWLVGPEPLPADVLTYHNDVARTGQNLSETNLTPANVSMNNFGLLFFQPVDGQIYGQPLYVSNVTITNKGAHNAVFVVTEHDSVYALDADSDLGSNSSPLWRVSFINPAAGITTVPYQDVNSTDLTPEIGITSTPVIDATSKTIYIEAKTKEVSGSTVNYVHRLHALDLGSGVEKFGGPIIVHPVVNGTGAGNDGAGHVPFNPLRQLNRPGLLLENGVVYLAFASHGDNGPYHGWVVGYNASTLQPQGVFNTTPNGSEAGIWESGDGPAADTYGNIYTFTGNGTFDSTTNSDYGDSFLKLTPDGTNVILTDYFTPFNEAALADGDLDLGSGGLVVLPDAVGNSAHPFLLLGAGKQGVLYLLDRANLGHFNGSNNNQIVQMMTLASCFSTPAYFNGMLYYIGNGGTPQAYAFTNGWLATNPFTVNTNIFGYPGASPSISANGTSNAILWAIQRSGNAILHAYNATNLADELYNSQQTPCDQLGTAVKFSVPTVANGKVYVGTAAALSVFGMGIVSPRNCENLLPTTSYTLMVSNDNPALYWNFDEISGNAQEVMPITASDDLVPVNGASRINHTADQDGLNLGNAASFVKTNGEYYFTSALNYISGQIQPPWLLEFLMQASLYGQSTQQDSYLIDFGPGGGNSPAVLYDYVGGADPRNGLEMFAAGTRTGAGPVITDPYWHHILFACYGNGTIGVANRMDIYLDGTNAAQDVQSSFSSSLAMNSQFLIGTSAPQYATFDGFTGNLDEVAVYDLSASTNINSVTAKAFSLAARHFAAAIGNPPLAVTLTNNQINISWGISVNGFALQSSPALSPPRWTNFPGSPTIIGEREEINLTAGDQCQFFRLKR